MWEQVTHTWACRNKCTKWCTPESSTVETQSDTSKPVMHVHTSQSCACIHGDIQQSCTCIHSDTHHNPVYGHRLTHITIQHVETWSYTHQTPIYVTTRAQMKHIQVLYGGNNSLDWQPPSSPHLASTPECGGLHQPPASPQVLSVDTGINGYQCWTSTLTPKNTNTKK